MNKPTIVSALRQLKGEYIILGICLHIWMFTESEAFFPIVNVFEGATGNEYTKANRLSFNRKNMKNA